jgi:ATP-dependent helicase HepA
VEAVGGRAADRRLDRIGRRIPVQVVYFRMAGSVGYEAARLFEDLGLFKEPMAGLEPQLGPVERALDDVAVTPEATLAADVRTALLGAAHAARTRIHEAAYHELHRDPYRADMGAGILARVPSTLDALNEHVVTRVCSRLGFKVERLRDDRVYAIELGSESLVDGLPGVAGGTGFVGTFDREEAVQDETIDYFASGHRLVEGVFAHFEDNTLGRVTRFAIEVPDERGEGLVAIYKDGPLFDVVALDAHARPRPAWAAPFRAARPLRVRRIVDTRGDGRHWRALARDLGGHLDRARRPYALISIVVRPPA